MIGRKKMQQRYRFKWETSLNNAFDVHNVFTERENKGRNVDTRNNLLRYTLKRYGTLTYKSRIF